MTKTRPQFSLYITSILTLLICSCSTWSKPKSNDESRQDSISTYSSTPSINIDSLAATIDTTSYTNTSQKYYEEDVDDDEEDDDYDLDDVYADDGYEDELFPQKTRHATVTYRGSSFKDTLYIGCEKFPQHDFYPINASGVM